MADRPKLGALDNPLDRKPEAAPTPPAEAAPNPAAKGGAPAEETTGDAPHKKRSTRSKKAKQAKPAPAPAAQLASLPKASTRVEVYSRIPEPVADRLDEAMFAVRKLVKAPRQVLVYNLLERHLGTSAGAVDALLADVTIYRNEVQPKQQPLRALFVRLPVDLADRLDETLFALRRIESPPTRQDVLAALIWLHLPDPNSAADFLQAA